MRRAISILHTIAGLAMLTAGILGLILAASNRTDGWR